jgi:hypothetical protein
MPLIRRTPFRRSLASPARRAAAAGLCVALLAAKDVTGQRWFSTDIVAPQVSQGALPASGYARFYVSSHLDPLRGRAYGADREFAMLVVNVSISPGGGAQAVDYPVALYDLRERRRVDVAALQLGEVRYLDLRTGSQPVVTVKVQAVPRSVADPFRRAVNSFNQQVQATPVASLVLDGAVPIGGLSRLLGSILPPEVEERWTTSQAIGLTSRPDMAVLPLNGRPAVIFFRPSGGNVRVPTEWAQIEPCAGNAGRICWADSHQPVADVPYVVLSVTMEDYRPLRDFGVPDFVCAPTGIADHVARLERAVREAPLSQQQRDLESRLLEHLRLVADAASGRMGTSEGTAAAAFRWARRYTGQGDPYWTRNGQEPAARYADCFTQLLTNAGSGAVNRWGYFSAAFATAGVWDRQPPAAGEARTAQLEEFLSTLLRPITVYELGAGEEYASLREEQRRIEAELLAGDRAVAAELAGARTVPALEAVRARLQARLRTPCESCREFLTAALLQADERIAGLQRTALAERAEEIGRLREALAAAVGAAEAVAATAAGAEGTDAAALQVLREQSAASAALLGEREPGEEALRQRVALLRAATDAVREALQAPRTPAGPPAAPAQTTPAQEPASVPATPPVQEPGSVPAT